MKDMGSQENPSRSSTQGPGNACDVCGVVQWVKRYTDLHENAFAVFQCTRCGLRRTWPALPANEMARYYSQVYYGTGNVRFNFFFERMTHFFQKRRARVLRRRVSPGPVLDVGCGRGILLTHLQSMGYQATGIEFSDVAAWHARKKLGLEVKTGDFMSMPLPNEQYSAIVFWHTLEHVSTPAKAIAHAADLLKKNGLLAIAVPNSESLQARCFGKHWFHLDVPRHYFHFGTATLKRLLTENGFRIEKIDHFCLEQNPYGWLQGFYDLLGFEDKFLYSLLKNSTTRTVRIREHYFQALFMVLLVPVLLPVSFIMTLMEAFMRRGGTIEVYARKQ